MADKTYDLVYVGAGSMNLVNAMYATKYGKLKVGMFEDRHEAGGGWCSEESPAPGFVANHCSHMHIYKFHHAPLWLDYPELEEYGVSIAKPIVGPAVAFREDDSWVGAYTVWDKDYNDKTYKLLSRFSERDAHVFMNLREKWEKYIYPAVLEWAFNPPLSFGTPDAMERLIMNPESGIRPEWTLMSPVQLMRDLFESPEVQSMGIRASQSAGTCPVAYASGIAALVLMFVFLDPIAIKGGNHQLAHAAQRVILENGGMITHSCAVDKIIIENGKAKGIRLSDGTEIEARLGVVCGANPWQLIEDLTGVEYWDRDIVRKVRNIEADWTTISWYTWALKEQPRYKAEAFNPDIPYSAWLTLARKGLEVLEKESYIRKAGNWPDPEDFNLVVSNWSIQAPGSFAPPGKAAIITEQFLQPATRYSEEEWKKLEKQHADEIISFWVKYCTNMTWDNVIGYVPITPHFTARHARNFAPQGNWNIIDMDGPQVGRFRPIAQLADLRNFPIKNLYPCSSAWPPVGSACSHQGYWVYKLLAEKHNLAKTWEGRAF